MLITRPVHWSVFLDPSLYYVFLVFFCLDIAGELLQMFRFQ